jgi:VanZ family protein
MTRTRIISLIAFFIYIAALCYLCFAKPDDMPSIEITFFGLPIDKVAHFLMFLPFPFLAFKSFEPADCRSARRILLLLGITAAGTALAALTEFIQGYLAYRSEEASDLVSDYMGLGTGVIIVIIYLIFRKHR